MYRVCIFFALFSLAAAPTAAGELPSGKWVRLGQGGIGQRACGALVYAPEVKRFLVLGGGAHWNAKGNQPYGDLALDIAEGKWENWYPLGKSFGPRFGPCSPPKFKHYYGNEFADAEGTNRANPNAHMWRWLYGCAAYDHHGGRFYFHGSGVTWSYAPAERRWAGIETATHPARDAGGPVLWSSMCYDSTRKQLVLFGGGNATTARGDVGTWTFDPASKTWTDLKLETQPPPRANSRLAFDAAAEVTVLFGGDQLDQLLADTWVFDGKGWQERKPDLSPSPRAGHAVLWMPRSKKLLLLGGYDYDSGGGYHGQYYKSRPLDAWTYDAEADRWGLVAVYGNGKSVPPNCSNGFLKAAVGDGDVVAIFDQRGGTWLCRMDTVRVDGAGTARHGVKPGAVARRERFYDPDWYAKDIPAADLAKTAAEYAALPVNRWVRRNPPKVPRPNMDWGSAMYLHGLDVIARFSGGHCAYSGTAPQVFDPRTNRWSIPFAPEFPMDHCNSDGGVPGEWSFKGRPWMPGHTWKATGVDKSGKRLVYLGRSYTWFFDPEKKAWERSEAKHPPRDVRKATVCWTPKGAAVLNCGRGGSKASLFLIDDATGEWKPMPVKGTLPHTAIDCLSTVYDSKRDRILIIAPTQKDRPGSVAAYDMKTGEAKWLDPAGRAKAVSRMRESVYIPEHDMVMTGGRVRGPDGKLVWALYDCAANKWRVCDFPGDDPLSNRGKKAAHSVSMGMMYDTRRKLIWVVDTNSQLTVLKFDPKTAALQDL